MNKFLAIHLDPINGGTFFVVDESSGVQEARYCAKSTLPQVKDIAIGLLKEHQLSVVKIMKRNNYPEHTIDELKTITGVTVEVME